MTDFDDAFDKRHDPQTGGYIKAQPDVIKDIKRLTIYRKGKFWIGKTSGGKKGCRDRWNGKYKSDKMNKMAIVYKSSSQDFVSDMEGDMIDEFWNKLRMKFEEVLEDWQKITNHMWCTLLGKSRILRNTGFYNNNFTNRELYSLISCFIFTKINSL